MERILSAYTYHEAPRMELSKIRFVLRKIRFGIRLSKVGSKVAPRLSKVGSKVEAMHCKHTTNTAPLY